MMAWLQNFIEISKKELGKDLDPDACWKITALQA